MIKTNEERFLELYWKYQKLVLHVAVTKSGDYHHAQDICQEVFLKMLRCVDLSLSDEEIKSWLLVVADHAAKDSLKKGGNRRKRLEVDFASAEVSRAKVAAGEYFDDVARKDFRSRILDHLKEVNEEQYELVLLVCCLDMSVADAAKRLNLNYNQASVRLSRARKWMRSTYGEEYQEFRF